MNINDRIREMTDAVVEVWAEQVRMWEEDGLPSPSAQDMAVAAKHVAGVPIPEEHIDVYIAFIYALDQAGMAPRFVADIVVTAAIEHDASA